MKDSAPTCELRVHDGGNAIVGERLTRSLRSEVQKCDGVAVRFPPSRRGQPGAKSGAVSDASLWVFLGTAATATGAVLVQVIKEWAVTKRRTVRLKVRDLEVEIPAGLDETQERIISKLLEDGRS